MELDACRQVKSRFRQRRTTRPRAAGAGYGLGIAPAPSGGFRLALRLHTPEAVGAELLAELEREAGEELDVRTVGRVRALDDDQFAPAALQTRQRPLRPGLSVGHPDVTAGTLGGFVRYAGARHLLSNNHVLAHSDQAAVGDATLQPGTADGGGQRDRVATLARWVDLDPSTENLVDCAIAALDDVAAAPEEFPGGALPAVADVPLEGGVAPAVQKLGRTTGHTHGRITAFEVDGIDVDYPEGTVTFDDQIEIEGEQAAFSQGGDSGSIIFASESRQALGLLFAGSSQGGPGGMGLTYANRLTRVLAELDAEWVAQPALSPESGSVSSG